MRDMQIRNSNRISIAEINKDTKNAKRSTRSAPQTMMSDKS